MSSPLLPRISVCVSTRRDEGLAFKLCVRNVSVMLLCFQRLSWWLAGCVPVFVVSRADGRCGFPVVPPNQAVLFCYPPTFGNSSWLLLICCVLRAMAQLAGLQVYPYTLLRHVPAISERRRLYPRSNSCWSMEDLRRR